MRVSSLLLVTWIATAVAAETPAPRAGTIERSQQREIAQAANAEVAAALAPYRHDRTPFAWEMDRPKRTAWGTIWRVRFPSPQPGPDAVNNTVYCEYYQSNVGDAARRPGVVVLHILNGGFAVARMVCSHLMVRGIDAVMPQMAYYGDRKPADLDRRAGAADIDFFVAGVRQTVGDVRRTRDWLALRPEVDPRRLGLTGVSLGAIVAALVAGVDGNFEHNAFALGGGDMAAILLNESDETTALRAALAEKGIAREQLAEKVRMIEPLAFASRVPAAGTILLNMKADEIIPRASTVALWEAMGRPAITWYDGGHYAPVWVILATVDRITRHFAAENWPVAVEP